MLENRSTSNPRLRSLLGIVGIEPGEGLAIGLCFAQSFALGVAYFVLYTAGTAIFLTYFDASAIAYVYVIAAVLLILIGFYFNRLEQRISLSMLLLGSMGSLLLLYCLLRIGLWASASSAWASWWAFLLIVALRISWTLINLVTWALAGRLFNVRQSRRLYPIIVFGSVLAIIISGLLVQPLIALVGIPNLLWFAIGGVAATVGLLVLTMRLFQRKVATVNHQPTAHMSIGASVNTNRLSWLMPFRDRYILWMLALTVLSALSTYLLEFIFIREANSYYQDTVAYASFFSSYLGIATLFILVVSVFSGTLFERLGHRTLLWSNAAAISFFAILTLIGYLLAGQWSILFWLVVLTKLSDDVLLIATSTATRILYQPLPASQRVWVQTVLESMVSPAAIGLVGLFLLSMQLIGELSTSQLLLILIILTLGWSYASTKVYDTYRIALRKALSNRRIVSSDPDETTADHTQVLLEGLQSANPGTVLYSLNALFNAKSADGGATSRLLGRKDAGVLCQRLPALLSHPAEAVRLELAQRLANLDWIMTELRSKEVPSWIPILQERLQVESSNQIRAVLCQSLIAQAEAEGDDQLIEIATQYLSSADSELRNGAVVGLLRHGGIQGVLVAGPRLLAFAQSTVATERALAAQLVGEVGDARFFQPLVPLLTDEKNSVRRAALQAAGRVRNMALWPKVAEALAEQATRRSAAQALLLGSTDVLPSMANQFYHMDQNSEMQATLARVVGQIGAAPDLNDAEKGSAAHLLWQWATRIENARLVQAEIWCGLRRSRVEAKDEEMHIARDRIERELAHVSWLLGAWMAVNQSHREGRDGEERDDAPISISTADSLLGAALVNELNLSRKMLFDLLALLGNRSLLTQVRRILERYAFNLEGTPPNKSLPNQAMDSHSANSTQPDNEEQFAYAQEVLDDLLPPDLKTHLIPILSGKLDEGQRESLQEVFPSPAIGYAGWLVKLVNSSDAQLMPWTKACTIFVAKQRIHAQQSIPVNQSSHAVETPLRIPEPKQLALTDAIKAHQKSQHLLIRETARWE
ncbi:MAG: Npt1/Npt2 family nucleotide transporter [Chloroflexota bacterium]